MAAKIVTYSMDEVTLKRMVKVMQMTRETNKSNLLRTLIDKEYARLVQLQEDEDAP